MLRFDKSLSYTGAHYIISMLFCRLLIFHNRSIALYLNVYTWVDIDVHIDYIEM